MAAAPISTAIGSPISGAHHEAAADHAGLADWQMLYILEALPAVVLGFFVLKYLTDTPSKAHWLAPEEREWLITPILKTEADARLIASRSPHGRRVERPARSRAFSPGADLLRHVASLALGLWAPLIIRQYGFGSFETVCSQAYRASSR